MAEPTKEESRLQLRIRQLREQAAHLDLGKEEMDKLPKRERQGMEEQAAKLEGQAGELVEELEASRWSHMTPQQQFSAKVQEAIEDEDPEDEE